MGARSAAVLTVLAALAVVACSGSSSPTPSENSSSGGSLGSGGLVGTGAQQDKLSDPQIFKVLETIHASRVAEAETATARASNSKVLDYAKAMADEHREAGALLAALEKQRSVVPADSKLSLTLAATSSVEVENLAGVASADFDKSYMQAQVNDHGKAQAVAESLLGMTSDGELKTNLTALKTMASDDHDQATMVLSSL